MEESDPWDLEIAHLIDPSYAPLKDCKPIVTQFSKIEKGQLFIFVNETLDKCLYRCLGFKTEKLIKFDAWIEAKNGTEPKCDVIEIECRKISTGNSTPPFYHFVHTKIYRPKLVSSLICVFTDDRPVLSIFFKTGVRVHTQILRVRIRNRNNSLIDGQLRLKFVC